MKKGYLLLIIASFNAEMFCFAQQTKIDSLLTLLKTDKEDTNRAIHCYTLCRQYEYIGNYDTAIILGKQALDLSKKLTFNKGIANSYNNIGNVYYNQGNYTDAIKNHLAALKIREQIGNKQGIANSYNNIGNVYHIQGNYPDALKNHFAALKIREQIGDKQGIASSYNNIGNVYYSQGNYPDALKNQLAALKIREQIGDKQGIAYSYNNIGNVYNSQGNYPDALKNYFASLKIREQLDDKQGIGASYNNIGNVYANQAALPLTSLHKRGELLADALKNQLASLKIKEQIGDKDGIASCYINIGSLAVKQNRPLEANQWLQKALVISKELGNKDEIRDSYSGLSEADSLMGNYKAAFEYHKLFIIYRDSLNNEETKKKSLQASMQYEFDKKEIAAKAEQDKLDAINAEEKQKQRIVIYAVAGLLILVAVFALFMYKRFRITNRQKVIIEKQKKLVDKAYEELHEKNKEIIDSIHYAKRIQTALITSEKYIANCLNRLMKSN
jgi:tetratricopeptide (TPR) repeat protein